MTGLEPIRDRLLDQRKAMRGVWATVAGLWRDQQALNFREERVLPLDARMDRVHVELSRLIEAVEAAQRELG
jgi:hypothetical protein